MNYLKGNNKLSFLMCKKEEEKLESITLGQIGTILAFLVGLIGSVEYLSIRLKKWMKSTFKEEIEPISKRLNDLEMGTDKNFLVRFLSDVDQGNKIDEVEWERFYETNERYHELGGNSYIDHKVEKLKKEGKL